MKKRGIKKLLYNMLDGNEDLIRKLKGCLYDGRSDYNIGFIKGALAARDNISKDLKSILEAL